MPVMSAVVMAFRIPPPREGSGGSHFRMITHSTHRHLRRKLFQGQPPWLRKRAPLSPPRRHKAKGEEGGLPTRTPPDGSDHPYHWQVIKGNLCLYCRQNYRSAGHEFF